MIAAVYLGLSLLLSVWETDIAIDGQVLLWSSRAIWHGMNFAFFLVWAGLVTWYIVAVRSMASQIKSGALAKDGVPANTGTLPQAVASQATVAVPQATASQATVVVPAVVVANPVS